MMSYVNITSVRAKVVYVYIVKAQKPIANYNFSYFCYNQISNAYFKAKA